MNFFEFYGLPLSFNVDTARLRSVFLQNSKKFHPDFHTLAGEAEQAEMLEQSTRNNEAYKILSDPDRRMRYILEIKGLIGPEETHPPLPQAFLMDMMDLNESLMELEFDFDPQRYEAALRSINDLEQTLDREIAPVLNNWTEGDGPQALAGVRDYFLKKRYLLRIRENLSKFAPR